MNPKPLEVRVRIRDLRKSQSLTQEMLAEQLGVSRQSIIALENGRYLPSLPLAMHIADVFDLPLKEIFLFEDEVAELLNQVSQARTALVEYSSCPPLNIYKIGKAIVLEANVAGYDKKDINVEVEPYAVTISAKVPATNEERQYMMKEMNQASFQRRIELGVVVNNDRSHAEVRDGTLVVSMPIVQGSKKKLEVIKE